MPIDQDKMNKLVDKVEKLCAVRDRQPIPRSVIRKSVIEFLESKIPPTFELEKKAEVVNGRVEVFLQKLKGCPKEFESLPQELRESLAAHLPDTTHVGRSKGRRIIDSGKSLGG